MLSPAQCCSVMLRAAQQCSVLPRAAQYCSELLGPTHCMPLFTVQLCFAPATCLANFFLQSGANRLPIALGLDTICAQIGYCYRISTTPIYCVVCLFEIYILTTSTVISGWGNGMWLNEACIAELCGGAVCWVSGNTIVSTIVVIVSPVKDVECQYLNYIYILSYTIIAWIWFAFPRYLPTCTFSWVSTHKLIIVIQKYIKAA